MQDKITTNSQASSTPTTIINTTTTQLSPSISGPIITKFSDFFAPVTMDEGTSFKTQPRIFVAIAKGKPAKGSRGTLKQELQFISYLNERRFNDHGKLQTDSGYNIYTAVHKIYGESQLVDSTPYKWEGGGAKKSDIEYPLSAFVEKDFPVEGGKEGVARELAKYLNFGASMVVESSPGKLHIYWRYADGNSISWEAHQKIQFLLAWKFNGDFNHIAAKQKLMRIAGLYHNKDINSPPFLTTLHYCNKQINYNSVDAIIKKCGFTATTIQEYKSWVDNGGLLEVLGNSGSSNGKPPVIAYDTNSLEYIGTGEGKRDGAIFNYILQVIIKQKGITDKKELLEEAIKADEKNSPPLMQTDGKKVLQDKCRSALSTYKKSMRERAKSDSSLVGKTDNGEIVGDSRGEGGGEGDDGFQYDYSHPDFLNPISLVSIIRRAVQRYGKQIANNESFSLMAYNGKCWSFGVEARQIITKLIRRCAEGMMDEPQVVSWVSNTYGGKTPLNDTQIKNTILQQIDKVTSTPKKMVELLQEIKELNTDVSTFEPPENRLLLSCNNGVIDLKTATLLPHSPKYKLVHSIPFDYIPEAKNKMMEKYIEGISNGDEELATLIQQICGYCLSGSMDFPAIFSLYSEKGGTGKSKLSLIMAKLLGFYYKVGADGLLTRKKGKKEQLSNTIMDSLYQATYCRMMVFNEEDQEANENHRTVWNQSFIKRWSGGDPFETRGLYKSNITIIPTAKLVSLTNFVPELAHHDPAFFRRLYMVPFTKVFSESDEEILSIEHEIEKDGMKGVLAWAVQGCKALYETNKEKTKPGFNYCAASEQYKAFEREQSSSLESWLETSTELLDNKDDIVSFGATKEEIISMYQEYCDYMNMDIVSGDIIKHVKRYLRDTTKYVAIDGTHKGKKTIWTQGRIPTEGRLVPQDKIGQDIVRVTLYCIKIKPTTDEE